MVLGKLDDAIKIFNKASAMDPNNSNIWYNMGIAYGRLKKYPDTLIACTKAAELNPKDALHWNCKGDALFDLKRYPEAKISYKQALEIEPDLPVALKGLADTLKFTK